MTFLNPFYLIGLAAASLPVLFHLFARRRSRRVEFSSLRFLQKLEKTSMRAVKLRQWLLLLVRTLLIACLVLAFARPALRGYLGSFFGSSHANSSVVFLIDNSASMTRSDEAGQLLLQAKRSAEAIASVMQQGDEATVIPLASIERGRQYSSYHSKQDVLKAIEDVRPADRAAELADGLRVASASLASSMNVNKEVYILTDAQTRNMRSTSDTVRRDSASMKLFDPATRIYTSVVGHGEEMVGKNLSLDSLKPVTTIFEPGRPVQFEAWVRNTSQSAIQNAVLSLFYNGDRVGQATIPNVASGSTERVSVQGPLRGSGLIEVKAELEPDALPFDNSRFTVLDIPASRRIAIYSADPAKATFINLALSQTLAEQQQSLPFTVEVKRLEELRTLPAIASHYDAAFVLMSPGISDVDLQGFRSYVASGHGAAIFLLPGLDPSINKSLASLGLPTINAKLGAPGDNTHYLSFAQFELSHPFFAGMFESEQAGNRVRGIESPHVFENYSVAVSRGIPLIKLSNGNPFLVELTLGKGDVLYYTVPPTQEFSDLPRRSIFLPLIRRTAAYASAVKTAQDENVQPAFVTTEPFQIELPQLAGEQAGTTLLLKGPDGTSSRARVGVTTEGKPFIRLDEARVAGNYTVYRDAEAHDPIAAFAVNVQSDEADLRSASEAELSTYLVARTGNNRTAIKFLKPDERTIAKAVQESRYGVELWQSFLYAAILLALIEMLIAREARRQPSAAVA